MYLADTLIQVQLAAITGADLHSGEIVTTQYQQSAAVMLKLC